MAKDSTKYNPEGIEGKWYEYWMEKGYNKSVPDEREAYAIVIPPPNVTGVLHMGHMLNNTIQDSLIRKARIDGKNACWVPGTDHASIATEAKVVRMLREEGIKKSDLTREEFLERAFEWKDKYGGIILKQLRKLGASCDWDRTAFTMDESRSEAVLKVFVDLYNKGKLYRKLRMVNWDPAAKTVLSNEEVLYKDESSKLYHVRYQIQDSKEFITIATTRPETILGDSGIAVHPEDERYAHLKDKKVIVPLVNRVVPIVFDDYVDREFGTGALKITPAHDVNDYEIGEKHGLEVIDVLNDDGTISEAGQLYIGQDRFTVRKQISKDLDEKGFLVDKEDYNHAVGRSERTNAVVEPKLSLQWYVDMKAIAGPALDAVMTNEIEFFPEKYKNTYRHWMENVRDWCISRQLWWGHRIPAWYYEDKVFVAETAEEALTKAKAEIGEHITLEDLKQDEDVLDTWFSSWLWPISVFDGFKDQTELDYYYPTQVLVTGWDIIFLWVARMIMSGYEWKGTFPFKHVYFTGMVRDQQRRKMSKSLGNSPDALGLIKTYGADGVRFGMLSCSPAGGDLLFDEALCDQGKKFCNKMWNGLNLIKGWSGSDQIEMSAGESYAVKWFEQQTIAINAELENAFQTYRLSEGLKKLYSFIWDDFFSGYLEMIKPKEKQISAQLLNKTNEFYSQICTMLHPFMPFITEEIWHQLKSRQEGEDCMVSTKLKAESFDSEILKLNEDLQSVTSSIRDVRNKNGLKWNEALEVSVLKNSHTEELIQHKGWLETLCKLSVIDTIQLVDEDLEDAVSFIVGTDKYFVSFEKEIDVEAELKKLNEELVYQEGFVKSVLKKLNNERFVNNAPEAVVNNERKKLADGQERIKQIQESIDKLS